MVNITCGFLSLHKPSLKYRVFRICFQQPPPLRKRVIIFLFASIDFGESGARFDILRHPLGDLLEELYRLIRLSSILVMHCQGTVHTEIYLSQLVYGRYVCFRLTLAGGNLNEIFFCLLTNILTVG